MEAPVKPMNPQQVTQLLTWLDAEHRQDKAQLAELQQKLEQQSALLQDQAVKLRALNEELTVLRAQAARLPALEEAQAATQGQVTQFQQQELRRQDEEKRAAAARQAQTENLTQALADLRARLDAQTKDSAAQAGKLALLEEHGSRHAAQATELRQHADGLVRQADAHANRLQQLEARSGQSDKQITELRQRVEATLQPLDAHAHRLQQLEARGGQSDKQTTELRHRVEVALTQLDTHAGKLQAVEQALKGYPQTFADLRHQTEGLTKTLDAQAARLKALETRQGQADERLSIVERLAEQLKDAKAQAIEQRRLLAESWESQRPDWQERTLELRQQREEQAAQLAHFVEERSRDREELGRLQQQVADLLQELEERTTRLIRLEDAAPQIADHLARLQELAAQQGVNQERLTELQQADEQRYTQEIPLLQKLLDDLDKGSKAQSGQLAQLLIEHAEDRQVLAMLQKTFSAQSRSTEQTLADWRELLSQQRRRQIISLEQEIKEVDALGKRKAERE